MKSSKHDTNKRITENDKRKIWFYCDVEMWIKRIKFIHVDH